MFPRPLWPPEVFERVRGLTQESSVIVTGRVRADKRAPGGYELDVDNVEVLQRVSEEEPFPITLKEHGVEFLMEHRHLWIRTPRQSAILRIRAEIIKAARDYLDDNGFVLTDPPILTPAACEGTSTLFPVDYFGDEAFLTQSGQLYIESTAMALGKVYSFGPTFRAEKSKTRRHLTEFWMVEPELAYCHHRRSDGVGGRISELPGAARAYPESAGLESAGSRHSQAGGREAALSPDHLRPSRQYAERRFCARLARTKIRVRERLWFTRRDLSFLPIRSSGHGASLPRRGKGVLHGARSRTTRTSRYASTYWRRKAMEKSSVVRSVLLLMIC